MDLEADLYFMTGADEEQDLIASAANRATPIAASASILDEAAAHPISVRDVLFILIELIRIRRALRTRPIAEIVARVADIPDHADPDSAGAQELARRFAAARKAVPIRRNCLPDAIALLAWLSRRNIPSTLVFGVKLDPFAAHCWVQSGDLLLTDRLEEIERFTPVRLVECAPATH